MPPAPSTPDIVPRSARTLLHALVLCLVAHALAPVLEQRPLGAGIAAIAMPLHFVPWSLAVAAGLNNDRIILAMLGVLIAINGWPDDLLPSGLAALLGLIIGAGVRSLLTEQQRA
jgi:hypothetical protein